MTSRVPVRPRSSRPYTPKSEGGISAASVTEKGGPPVSLYSLGLVAVACVILANPAVAVPAFGRQHLTTSAPLTWQNFALRTHPSPRSEFAFAEGPAFALLFGGRENATVFLNDSWIFADGRWNVLQPTPAPIARRGAMMVYDPPLRGFVLFGGYGGAPVKRYLNDTWLFHAGRWALLHPAAAPGPRRVGAFVWDPADGYAVLFSGHQGPPVGSHNVNQSGWRFYDDTWMFTRGNWTRLFPARAPAARAEPSAGYDPLTQSVVLFGGYETAPHYRGFNDTWSFRAGQWTPLAVGGSPPSRDGAAFAYDHALGGFVLEGGQNESSIS
jgi:hypothetical protein